MNREAETFFRSLPPEDVCALEVSGDLRAGLSWASYDSRTYPAFDLCATLQPDHGEYDLVICEQVLEHVPDPMKATENLRLLCRPGGRLFVSTPFLLRIHEAPGDYWRFTPDGLRLLLERQGFDVLWTRSWGNRACVKANLRRWAFYRPWRSLQDDGDVPVVVWALARR